jgi:nucleotide sugar dehydrogenase
MNKSVCIIGLGYVGLPLALLSAEKGYIVYGLEVNEKKIEQIKRNYPQILLNHPFGLKADILIIAVPTPIDERKMPDLTDVKNACNVIAENLDHSGRLVILESTVNPFVSRKIILPIFEKSGLKEGKDFYLAHCPERIDPGNKKWNVSNIPRVVGGISDEALKRANDYYKSILNGDVMLMSSIEAAEMVKIYENSLRAVNIAFANEMAIVMQNLKLDVKEILKGVKTKPFGLDLCSPSCGVGGHCIPVDPFYLIEESMKRGFDPRFLATAMKVNGFMPSYTVSLLMHAMNDVGKSIRGSTIGILGVSYKKNVEDLRESPSLEIIKKLNSLGAIIKIYDPYIPDYSNASPEEILNCDAVMLLAEHDVFLNYDFSKVPVFIDGKNALEPHLIGGIYKGIGR